MARHRHPVTVRLDNTKDAPGKTRCYIFSLLSIYVCPAFSVQLLRGFDASQSASNLIVMLEKRQERWWTGRGYCPFILKVTQCCPPTNHWWVDGHHTILRSNICQFASHVDSNKRHHRLILSSEPDGLWSMRMVANASPLTRDRLSIAFITRNLSFRSRTRIKRQNKQGRENIINGRWRRKMIEGEAFDKGI